MMKRKYWTIIFVSFIVILLSDNIRLRIVNNKIYSDSEHKEYLINIKDDIIWKTKDNCSTEIAKLEQKIKDISPGYEIAISRLKRMGLADPLNNIRDNLMQNQNLIPNRDMPKGKVYFQRDQISIINSRWVLAYYEDGHFNGELLAEMTIDKFGHISWKVIDDSR